MYMIVELEKPPSVIDIQKFGGSQARREGLEFQDGYFRPGSFGALDNFNVPHRVLVREEAIVEDIGGDDYNRLVDVVVDEHYWNQPRLARISYLGIPFLILEIDKDLGIMYIVSNDTVSRS